MVETPIEECGVVNHMNVFRRRFDDHRTHYFFSVLFTRIGISVIVVVVVVVVVVVSLHTIVVERCTVTGPTVAIHSTPTPQWVAAVRW